jgi:tRNA threonylcarbamoyl adenosine modification protein YeaZ
VTASRPVLAFDSGSPRASAALATAGRVVARREAPRDESERDLLRLLAAVLADASLAPRELGGVVALAGPGSFTGVRMACAAAQALAQACDVPAAGYSTLAALALAAPSGAGEVLSVVDALRGEWFVQRFGPPDASGLRPELAAPELWRPGDPSPYHAAVVCGFGAQHFAALTAVGESCEPEHLAAHVATAVSADADWRWDASLLTRPLHLRAPATTRPRA